MSRYPIEERFWPKVYKTDYCWFWIGGVDSKGYGCFYVNDWEIPCETHRSNGRPGGMKLAHRVAWFLTCGRWPEKDLLHTCDIQQCIRPDHTFEGTQKENSQDAARKGTMGASYFKPFCAHGHPRPLGQKHCKICDREAHQLKRDLLKSQAQTS